MTDMNAVRRYATLHAQKQRLKERLAEVQSQMNELGPAVIDAFVNEGLDSAKITLPGAGSFTVHTRTVTRAKVKDGIDRNELAQRIAVEADPDWAALVKYDFNLNAVSAAVRAASAITAFSITVKSARTLLIWKDRPMPCRTRCGTDRLPISSPRSLMLPLSGASEP